MLGRKRAILVLWICLQYTLWSGAVLAEADGSPLTHVSFTEPCQSWEAVEMKPLNSSLPASLVLEQWFLSPVALYRLQSGIECPMVTVWRTDLACCVCSSGCLSVERLAWLKASTNALPLPPATPLWRDKEGYSWRNLNFNMNAMLIFPLKWELSLESLHF